MGIGMKELLIILLVVLLVFGAKKLRTIGSDLGSAVRGFKKSMSEGEEEGRKQIKQRCAGRRVRREGWTPRRRRRKTASPDRPRADAAAMFEVGFTELLVIFVLALVVLGPEKLPRLAAQVGRWVGRARAMARQFREQLEEEVNVADIEQVAADLLVQACSFAAQARVPSQRTDPARRRPAIPVFMRSRARRFRCDVRDSGRRRHARAAATSEVHNSGPPAEPEADDLRAARLRLRAHRQRRTGDANRRRNGRATLARADTRRMSRANPITPDPHAPRGRAARCALAMSITTTHERGT